MLKRQIAKLIASTATQEVSAHCDGPCGVYDPASTRIAAEAVLSMTKKIKALEASGVNDASYHNSMARFVAIKEEQAQIAKDEALILWTDYFKPQHLEKYPDLHDLFWKTAKLCSTCKQEVNEDACNQLMDNIQKIHKIFWETKGRDIEYYTAS